MQAEARQDLSVARSELATLEARRKEDAQALEDARRRTLELERIKGDAEVRILEAKARLERREEELVRSRGDLQEVSANRQ